MGLTLYCIISMKDSGLKSVGVGDNQMEIFGTIVMSLYSIAIITAIISLSTSAKNPRDLDKRS